MSTQIPDVIEKQVTIRAPKERVFAAIAEPDQLVKWFPDALEGTLNAGDRPTLDFGEYGKLDIYIVASEPHRYFAYRWVSGSALIPQGFQGDVLAHPNTLVEFFLEETPGGTQVKVRESGFASLPIERAELNFKDNTEGWEFMLDRLAKLLD